MADYFSRAANNVLKAADEITARMEEGIAAIVKGEKLVPPAGDDATGTGPPSSMGDEFEDIEEDLMNSPLEGIAESVLGDLMANQAKPEGIWDHLEAFRSAITWSEPFIVGLLSFQIVMFLACLYVSRPSVGLAPRLSIMVFMALLVRSVEYMNRIAGQHWKDFATQNYFDHRGVFVSIMVSGPLLIDCLLMLLLFVREASQLLVMVKTKELKKKRKQQNAAGAAKKETKKEQ